MGLGAVSLGVAALCAAAPRLWSAVRWPTLAAVALVGVAALAAGAAAGARLAPWSSLAVLVVALGGGTLLGRAVPPRPVPMLALLLILGALDALQLILPGPAPAAPGVQSAAWSYGMLVLPTPVGEFHLGIADVLLVAAIGEHSRRRGSGPLVAVAPGVIGLGMAGVVALLARNSLPLVPFLAAGYLVTQAAAGPPALPVLRG